MYLQGVQESVTDAKKKKFAEVACVSLKFLQILHSVT